VHPSVRNGFAAIYTLVSADLAGIY